MILFENYNLKKKKMISALNESKLFYTKIIDYINIKTCEKCSLIQRLTKKVLTVLANVYLKYI